MADDPRIGVELQGRYKVLARIGEGAMGVVYRAERIGLGRHVAVKFLHEGIAGKEDARARFEREARATSRLTHPNCIPVIDYGFADVPYIVLELVEGKNLAELLHEGAMSSARAVDLVGQILAGLAHAHE